MPNVKLRKMNQEEFETFHEYSVVEYAKANVTSGRWSESESLENSRSQFKVLIPNGLETVNNEFLIAVDDEGNRVGHLWLNLDYRPGTNSGSYIYDIEIEESARGKGYGKALLVEAERFAKSAGSPKMGLNGFGANTVARNLYTNSGYETVAIQMQKTL